MQGVQNSTKGVQDGTRRCKGIQGRTRVALEGTVDHKRAQIDSMRVQNSMKGCRVYKWDTKGTPEGQGGDNKDDKRYKVCEE